MYHETFSANWNLSVSDCFNFHGGAHLCSYEEIRRACVFGGFTPINNSWLADRSGDDAAVRTTATTATTSTASPASVQT